LLKEEAMNGKLWKRADDWQDNKEAHRKVCDFIAGMTDRYALELYEHLFMPKPWTVR
jgi:dGTPase